ncbi:MAG: SEL1-like repeat protein [Bacteroidetes bacterium]|nr:SEL1-like repeat protein [Bacteroidota bacterium]
MNLLISLNTEDLEQEPSFKITQKLITVIPSLPFELKEVLILIDIIKFNYGAAADLIDIPAGTVRKRIFDARKSLLIKLLPDGSKIKLDQSSQLNYEDKKFITSYIDVKVQKDQISEKEKIFKQEIDAQIFIKSFLDEHLKLQQVRDTILYRIIKKFAPNQKDERKKKNIGEKSGLVVISTIAMFILIAILIIISNPSALSTKEIAEKVRMPGKAVSSQLNQLVKNQLKKKIPTSTKNQLYQVSERFFNIYYLMRLGKRKSRKRVLWLIKFFELWCGEKELIERTQKQIKAIKENRIYEKHAFYLAQALSGTGIPSTLQHELITETRNYLTARQSDFCDDLEKSHFEVFDEVLTDIKSDNIQAAKQKLVDDGANPNTIDYVIGLISETEFKDFDKAEKYYLMAVKKDDPTAMNNLALLYQSEFKDFDKAEKYYLMAVKKDDPTAMFNLALLYQTEFKDFDKAEKYYLMAVEKDHPVAMNNLALLYQTKFKDFDNAEKYYLAAVKKDYPDAMNNLAWFYYEMKKKKQKAANFINNAYKKEQNIYQAHTFIIILLWVDEIERAIEIYKKHFDEEVAHKDVNEMIQSILLMFIAKKQYNFVYKLFNENKVEIKNKYKQKYFAMITLMGDKQKDELRRMGDELQDTVNEIIEKTKQLEKDYT